MLGYIHCSNDIFESWAVSTFKFQWQKLDEYLAPGFPSILPQQNCEWNTTKIQ